jgi:diguanylate cyclase (GGDEF)-like protein
MDPKERRSSPRQPIQLAAQLGVLPGEFWPCQIADFCAEGLFIRYSQDVSRKLDNTLPQSDNDELTVRFRSPSGEQHELHVRIARRVDGAMGVSFSQGNPRAVSAMLEQCGGQRQQERSSLKAPSDRVQYVLHQSARTIVQHVEPLMEDFFVQIDKDLEAAALKAGNDQQANEYMDARGQLKARRRVIWHQMANAIKSPLKPASKTYAGAELSVVDKTEFEDWLSIRVMVTKADTQYRGELLQLKLRLDKLGIANATGHQNPLGPSLICEAFHTGLEQFRATRSVEKLCLKTFEKSVVQHLEPMYQELNQILVRQGVLPDLDLSRYLSDVTKTSEPSAPPKPAPPKPQAPAPEPPKPAQPAKQVTEQAAARQPDAGEPSRSPTSPGLARTAFATIRNLVSTLTSSRLQRGDEEPVGFPPGAAPISPTELQRELQKLQLEPVADEEEPDSLRDRVFQRVAQESGQSLDQEQRETVDVVDRFFQSVVESPRLGEYARRQMRQLEVPVLKVVMRDPEFFEDQESPVRGVMNRLAQLGVRGGRINPVVQRRIDELIRRIVSDFEQDTGVFESAVGELDNLIERQNLVYRRNVERVTAAAEGAQKVTESKVAVAEALNHKLAGRDVPKAVLSLLDGGWRDLLSLTWLRQGEDSALWADYLAVIDSLLAFAEDPSTDINLPELLRVIQDGLASISSNHMPATHIREELKRFLVRKPDTPPEMVPFPEQKAPAGEAKLTEREQKSLQRWIARAQRLRTGDWLRDQTRPDDPQHIRLVWIARGFTRFVFVNHQGMRVVEMDLADLARQMRKGIVVPDNQYDRPLVDESIDRMVRNVYEQLSWVSTHDELTGLLSRREFERMLDQQLARQEDERALLRLDLRQFRLLNDTAGYQSGDEALKRVAAILLGRVPDGMPVARLAGNEFALLLPAEEAQSRAKEIIREIEALDLAFDNHHYRLSACGGLAHPLPTLASAERWLRAAEDALKTAKKQGSGKLVEYALDEANQALQEQIAAKIASLGELDEERMLLRCQKIIPLHSRSKMTPQYEVLISMYDDEGNLVTGTEFVRMAERYDRMQVVDRWVVGHMLDWLRDHNPDPEHLGGLCINLSGYSLNDETLLEFIYEKLSGKDAPIERLWFEITEAAAITDLAKVADFIHEMKELGCRFCLGNFGSGPVSHHFLRVLPVDLIKLDGAFSEQIRTSQTDQAMVRTMADMAHYMGREVIATRVETREALEALRQLGVDYAQGFIVEKPRLLDSLG